jgi:uncharacterized protein
MMKVRRILAWLVIVALACAMTACAESVSQLQPSGYVNDFALVLDPNTKAQIEDIAQQIDQKAHAEIALVTVHSLDGADIETYALDLFKKWGIGEKATNRGVLILYAIQDRRARIEVGYGLEPILPDGKVGSFQREAIPLMQSGDYNHALLLVTSRVASVIAEDAGVQITGAQAPESSEEPAVPARGLSKSAILAIVILGVIVLVTPPLRRLLFWILFSQMIGGGSSRSGGGAGGFGGGGGFGGFGGGSSGGGGASSSW